MKNLDELFRPERKKRTRRTNRRRRTESSESIVFVGESEALPVPLRCTELESEKWNAPHPQKCPKMLPENQRWPTSCWLQGSLLCVSLVTVVHSAGATMWVKPEKKKPSCLLVRRLKPQRGRGSRDLEGGSV